MDEIVYRLFHLVAGIVNHLNEDGPYAWERADEIEAMEKQVIELHKAIEKQADLTWGKNIRPASLERSDEDS